MNRPPEQIPERIGVYPIERELGRGGMGIVYLGRDTRLDRQVAIKVLSEEYAEDSELLSRFEERGPAYPVPWLAGSRARDGVRSLPAPARYARHVPAHWAEL